MSETTLQSAARPPSAPPPSPPAYPPPLPPAWTQHKAPTGHAYYHNKSTKQSTYTRPGQAPAPPAPPGFDTVRPRSPVQFTDPFSSNTGFVGFDQGPPSGSIGQPFTHESRIRANRLNDRGPRQPQDRPKTRHDIPGCAPWVLVKTRLGRRFVHNPESGESFWKFPEHVVQGVVEYDIQERKKAEGTFEEKAVEAGGASKKTDEPVGPRPLGAEHGHEDSIAGAEGQQDGASSDEYEEVEVTDEEDAEDGSPGASKRPRLEDDEANAQAEAPQQFDEEDMAYQLAQMGQAYDLDPGEYGTADPTYGDDTALQDENDYEEDGTAGLPTTAEEATSAFADLLTDHALSPYTTWDHVITSASDALITDPRYTLLLTTKARRAAFQSWSTAQIAALKAQEASARERKRKPNPRVPYLALLHAQATPKLYWPEFRRKFKKEAVMRDAGVSEREKEKLFREHVSRVTRKSEAERKADLKELMRSLPVSAEWCRSVDVDDEAALPDALIADVRWISLKKGVRDGVVGLFVEGLPAREEIDDEDGGDERNEKSGKTEQPLRERQRQVDAETRRQRAEMHKGRGELMRQEDELRRAVR